MAAGTRSRVRTKTTVPISKAEIEDCCICMSSLSDDGPMEMLEKCSHKFHKACIMEWFQKSGPSCPICKTLYGVLMGAQPKNGTMNSYVAPGGVAGYKCQRHIVIEYNFPNGVQGPEHPRPGKTYTGTSRIAYLPDTPDGRIMLKLLDLAFKNRLVFTVGDSITTGAKDTVVWNNIHHKTQLHEGPFGYPDPQYLNRLEEELAVFGIVRSAVR